ncbi:MAG: hypothetical protein IIC74_08460, partial [Bacteroidetes bacterium]|nr:hypothetical protein [Bacteroidota bacterium]
MKKYIEFKKQRDLGEVLGDTFTFIRHEVKPFINIFFSITGPYLLLFLIAMAFYLYSVGDAFNFSNFNQINNEMYNLGFILFSLLAVAITGILAYISANSVTLHYIKSYIKNNGNINVTEIKQDVKQTFLSFIGLGITKWIVLIISMFLCFLPFIYFIVPMTIMFSVFVFEKKDISDSFSYSFKLIKGEYWITLLTIIVVGIIVAVTGYAFGLPAGIYGLIKVGIFSGEIDPTNMDSIVDPIYIILNLINYLANFLLNIISIIASVFIYFN